MQLNVTTLAAGQKAAGTATLQPIPGSPNNELVLNLQIPEGAQGKPGVGIADVTINASFVEPDKPGRGSAKLLPIKDSPDKLLELEFEIPKGPPGAGIADVELQVSYVPHGRTVTNSATLLPLPGTPDKSLVLSLQIPEPPPATVDFATADKRYVQKAGDIMTGRLAVDSYLFSKWLVIGAASGSLDGSWGLVQEGGGRVGESGTLRIGTFVNAGEAMSGKLHVPVMTFTSTEVTIIQEAKFTRDLTAERDLRVLGLLDAGDVVGRDAEFDSVNVARDLTVRGCKFFVQAPPEDPSVEIYYAALEGPEPGTYVRGEAELVAGEAMIELPEHFALVTSSQGLTVQLTPIGEWLQLYVVELSPQRLVVREAQGKDGKFFYLVQGVRKGYEGFQVVREKE